MSPDAASEHRKAQSEATLKFCGQGMEVLDGIAQAADAGAFAEASEWSANLAKNLMDLSRMLMAADAIEAMRRSTQ